MKLTGQILKENRERKGISVAEVAFSTKINAKTIIAIETGDIKNLPPKTFLRGFVRSYAGFLGLDVESILNTFFEEMGSTVSSPKTSDSSESDDSDGPHATTNGAATASPSLAQSSRQEAHEAIHPRTSNVVKIAAVAGILALVILILIFKSKMESYEKEAVVAELPKGIAAVVPVAASAQPSPPSSPLVQPLVQPSASASASSSLNASFAPSLTPTLSPTMNPSVSPSQTPSPSSVAKPSPVANAQAKVSGDDEEALSTPSPTPKKARPQEVIIEALREVSVEVTIDGEARKLLLKPDEVQTFKAKRKVSIQFSDGGAVNLIVNGNDRGVPGDLGKPTRVDLP
jgi:cytoskeleton protein RodZ